MYHRTIRIAYAPGMLCIHTSSTPGRTKRMTQTHTGNTTREQLPFGTRALVLNSIQSGSRHDSTRSQHNNIHSCKWNLYAGMFANASARSRIAANHVCKTIRPAAGHVDIFRLEERSTHAAIIRVYLSKCGALAEKGRGRASASVDSVCSTLPFAYSATFARHDNVTKYANNI